MNVELPTESEPVRVVCGDALDVLRALPAGCIDAVITDPPYCSGAATEAGRGSATHQGLRSETIREGRFQWFDADNMTTSGLVWLLRSIAVASSRALSNSGSVMAFCDWRMVTALAPAMESGGFRLRNLVVWDKGHFGCGSGFRPQHEMILHLTKRAPDFFAQDVGNVIRSKRIQSSDRDHPTEKPVDLIEELVRVVTPPGGLVLDCFGGSGTTAVAALHEGRRCLIVEKDAGYCDIIRRRVAEAMGEGKGSLLTAYAQPDLFSEEPA